MFLFFSSHPGALRITLGYFAENAYLHFDITRLANMEAQEILQDIVFVIFVTPGRTKNHSWLFC